MRRARLSALGTAATVIGALAQPVGGAHAVATTVSVDNLRTGWDSAEPGLGPATIASSSFGKVFSTPVDGQVYAQPIMAGDVLVAVTENNKAYGLDPATGAIAWQGPDFGPAWPVAAISCGDLTPNIGITSSPVYDPATGTVYMTSKTYSGGNVASAHWYLHALDAETGRERPDWPVEIKGTADNDPTTQFDAFHQMQRPGLLLMDGVVYAGFGGHCDVTPYRGYVVGVDTATARQTAMWTDEAGGASSGAGIWQSGSGLMSDGDGRIFLSTGNGMSPNSSPGAGVTTPPDTLGESVVRLQVNPDKTLSAADFFSPSNNATLDVDDADLGSGGPIGLPDAYFRNPAGTSLLVEQGKDGRVFLLDRDGLGGMGQGPNGTDDAVSVTGPFSGLWGHPAVFGGDGGWVYLVSATGPLRAFHYGVSSDGTPSLSAAGASADIFGYTSGSPLVTSDGTDPNSAVVWAVYSPTGASGVNAELRGYSAIPNPDGSLSLLYSAPIGTAVKFTSLASDHGHIYVGTRDGHVIGFGSPTTAPLTAPQNSFGQVEVKKTGTGTVTLTATRPLTVTGAKTSSSVFGVNTSGAALPHDMAAGDTLVLPVTFSPSAPGAISAILSVATSAGTVGVSLTGTGTQDGLGSNPPKLAFDADQPTGISSNLPVRIVNTGTTDETIGSVTGPAAGTPFTVAGLPSPGQVLAPGEGVDATVTFLSTTPGNWTDSIDITSTSGNGTADTLKIPLSGGAVDGVGELTLSPSALDFGDVVVGASQTLKFSATNTGNVPVTIRKAKAPAGVFSTGQPPNESMVLGPGQGITLSVTFTPTAVGPAADRYEITGDTAQGAMYVPLTGNGTQPVVNPPLGGGTPPPPDPAAPPPPPAPAAPPPAAPLVTRLAGDNRYLTGVAVSQAQWANAGGDGTSRAAARGVVLARGDLFPDALAGVPLAAKVHGPLLLTQPAALTKDTENEIRRVLGGSGTVDILGGTSAVSPAVENRLRALGYTVNRYAGADRDATALDVARRGLGDPAHVVLATGLDFADALAAGPFAAGPAASGGIPAAVLPTDGKTLDPRVAAYVRAKAAASTAAAPAVWAVGGQAATASKGLGGFVQVYAGSDRYDTDAKLVRAAAAAGGVLRIGVATGSAFPDALTGGAFAANAGAQLVTVESPLEPTTLMLLQELQPTLVTVALFGGSKVISPALTEQVTGAVHGKAAG
ncbi:MAG: cell wall-binding repeat-containing protein [Catenulisporales bacterium]|nr:cell wall-binding repeat-containing protein [Catenulisporales bacterium]